MANKTYLQDNNLLNEYQLNLNNINDEANEVLTEFEKVIDTIEEVWSGIASGNFQKNYKQLLSDTKKHHNEMKQRNRMLNLISEHLEDR